MRRNFTAAPTVRSRLSGVADGDTVRSSARSADMATERPTSLVVSSTVKPELVLVPQTAVQLCGQVVDNRRAPVAGATVTVKKKVVIREEGGMPEFSQAEDLLPDGGFVRTDAGSVLLSRQHRLATHVSHSDRASTATHRSAHLGGTADSCLSKMAASSWMTAAYCTSPRQRRQQCRLSTLRRARQWP